MLANPWVWIAALILAGLVIGLALGLGRGADVSIGLRGLRLRAPQPEPRNTINVATAADVGGKIGKVRGRVSDAATRRTRPADIDVASNMVVRPGGRIEEITGEMVTGERSSGPTQKAGP